MALGRNVTPAEALERLANMAARADAGRPEAIRRHVQVIRAGLDDRAEAARIADLLDRQAYRAANGGRVNAQVLLVLANRLRALAPGAVPGATLRDEDWTPAADEVTGFADLFEIEDVETRRAALNRDADQD